MTTRRALPQSSSRERLTRPLQSIVAALALAVFVASPAQGAGFFHPVASPTTSADQRVCDLVPAAGRLHALVCRNGATPIWRVSSDGAASWSDVPDSGLTDIRSIVIDGSSVRAFGSEGTRGGMAAFNADGSLSPAVLVGDPVPGTAFTGLRRPDGGLSVALGRNGPTSLADVGADGSVLSSTPLAGGTDTVLQMAAGVDGAISVRKAGGTSGGVWSTYPPGAPPVTPSAGPKWLDLGDGNALYSRGQLVAGTPTTLVAKDPVPGAPDLWQDASGGGGSTASHFLYETWGGFMLAPLPIQLPPSTSQVTSDGTTLFAFYESLYRTTIAPHELPFDETALYAAPLDHSRPTSVGSASAASAAMVPVINAARTDSGFPPITADGLIAQAAANHSRYGTLNPGAHGLDLHNETAGTPGFTGGYPGARCDFVGAVCDGEVMFPGTGAADAAAGWLPTIFHGGMLISPDVVAVGGGKVGSGPAVMDLRLGSALMLRPHGFPQGRWRGQLGFSGEIPDPGADCVAAKQRPIREPYGMTVTAFLPGGDSDSGYGRASGLTLADAVGRAIPGCVLGNSFIPEDPLLPGQTYTATATWQVAGVQEPPFKWTFTTDKAAPTTGNPDPRAQLVTIGRRARRAHGRHVLVIRAVAPAIGRVAKVTSRRICRPYCRYARDVTSTVTLARNGRLLLPRASRSTTGWRVILALRGFKDGAVRHSYTRIAVFVRR